MVDNDYASGVIVIVASEILAVPEEFLPEVIKIIRTGLIHTPEVSEPVREQLTKWCSEEEAYLEGSDD